MNSSLLGTGPKSTEHVEKHRAAASSEYPEHSTATSVVPVLRLQFGENTFSPKKALPCFVSGLQIHLFWGEQCLPVLQVLSSASYCKCIISFILHNIANLWLFNGCEIYLASAGGEGNPQGRQDRHKIFHSHVFKMAITSFSFPLLCYSRSK